MAPRHRISRQVRVIAALLALSLLITYRPDSSAQEPSDWAHPDQIQLISPDSGLLVADGRLYRRTTAVAGEWEEVTPSGSAAIAAFFLTPDIGWSILSPQLVGPYDGSDFRLAATRDGGRSWEVLETALPAVDGDAPVAQAQLFFVTPDDGWLVWRYVGSSNFREGSLFRTRDGGLTWDRLAIPFGEPVLFADAQNGWVAGGPAGDQLYRTADGGDSWTRVAAPTPAGASPDARPLYGLPSLQNGAAILPVTWTTGEEASEVFYLGRTGGESWRLAATEGLPATGTMTLAAGGESLIVHDGKLWALSADRLPELRGEGEFVALALAGAGSQTVAWMVQTEGGCNGGNCRRESRLFRTVDGGRTWSRLPWPDGFDAEQTIYRAPASSDGTREIDLFRGHGFDKCEIATIPQLWTWITESPYRAVNLYMGGASRACTNAPLSAAYLQTLRSQGWVFIPTWVGPQAPCTSYNVRMSADPAVAYQQGQTEGNAAIAKAIQLELANEDGSGTVVYYDLEYFSTSNAACVLATQAFITGWTERIKATGSQAGVYSTGCVINGQASNIPPPDAIWVANWVLPPQYRPDASVWNLYCLPNTLWSNHQRLRQYAGGHNETWGGVMLNIDSNVLDGPVTPRILRLWLPLIREEGVALPQRK